MPSPSGQNPKDSGLETFSTTLRQATANTRDTVTYDGTTPKNPGLKLPQLRADERDTGNVPPANENSTLFLMESWQRGKRYISRGSKQHLPSIIMFCGATLSAMWLAAAVVYVHNAVGWQNIANLMPHEIGGFLAGLLAPIALFWMMLTFWLRSVDVKLYAETLRDEIQGMIFPSEEAERRVNNDIDRLMKQTAEMSRATRMALGTLQQARQAMQGETQALQTGVQHTAERLEELEQRLSTRQEKLATLHDKFEEKGQALEKVSAQLLKDSNELNQIVDNASYKAETIGQILQAPVKQLQGWQNEIVDALNSSLEQISDKQTLMRLDAKAIEEKAAEMAIALQQGTSKLYDFSDDALDKAKLIETRLQGQSLSLQNTLEQIVTQTEALTTQRDALTQLLQNTTEQGRDELKEHISLLDQTTAQLTETQSQVAAQMKALLQDASTQLKGTQDSVSTHIQTLLQDAGQTWTTQADTFNQSITTSATKTVDLLGQAQTSMKLGYDTLQSDIEAATRKINMMLQHIQVDLSDVTGTIQNSVIEQHQQTKDFVDSMVRDNQAKTVATATGLMQLQKDLTELSTQLADRGQALGETGERNAATLQALYAVLDEGMDKLASATQRLQSGVDTTRSVFEEPVRKLEDAARNAHDKAQVIGNILDQRIGGLNQLSTALTAQATSATDELEAKSQELTYVLSRLQSSVTLLNADLEVQSGLLDTRVRTSLDQANAILPQLHGIQQNLGHVADHADRAQGNILRLSDAAMSGSQHMIEIADTTVSRVQKTLDSYQDIQSSYQAINQATLDHYEQMQARHQQSVNNLASSAAQIMDDADKVSLHYQKLREVLQSLQQESGQSQASAAQATGALQQTHNLLMQTVEGLQRQTGQGVMQIENLQSALRNTGEISINQIRDLAMAFEKAGGQSDVLLAKTGKLTEDTIKHSDAVQHAVDGLDKVMAQTDQVFDAVNSFDTRLTSLNDKMSLQQSIMEQQGTNIEEMITLVLDKMRHQTDNLAEATHRAGQQAETIRQQDQHLQRDYFFNATKFIVESLHSLALDFTRMLDGELPEKTWKAYQKGDTSVFTKRLVSLRDTISHDKIRQKFKDDVEFRTYVQRYLRQFEEIHNHAKQQDYSDLLSGVFMSSDIGRLYQMLKDVIAD